MQRMPPITDWTVEIVPSRKSDKTFKLKHEFSGKKASMQKTTTNEQTNKNGRR